jgi:hypothetical protein
MLVREAVETVRSMLTGSQIDEVSVLAAPYDPNTDTSVTLRYPKRNVSAGSIMSVGMNTFVILSVGSDGSTFEVLPSIDGGPNVAAPENEIVRFRPAFTTWAIFRELQGEINSMSSPDTGLYWPYVYTVDTIDRVSGTYPIPWEEGDSLPMRLLRSEYRVVGTSTSQVFTDAEYQPTWNQVRVFSDPPDASAYSFTLSFPFGQMTDLDTDLSSIGVYGGSLTDIPILGAASTMALGWEGRRTQPNAQGDSRRAGEVPVNSNTSLARQWKARQAETIIQEQSRLMAMFGYRQPQTYGYDQWRR